MLTRDQKQQQSQDLRAALDGITAVFLLENAGLKVPEVTELRSQVRRTNATYKVVKNSVVRLAVQGTKMESLAPYLVGPKALAFTAGDSVALAKVLRDFAKTHPALTFRQAFLEGQLVDPEEATRIADMPSKEELLTKLVFLLQSPIRRLVVALNSPAQKLASVLGQVAGAMETKES